MKMPARLIAFVIAASAALPQSAHACAACMGDPNSNIAGAANGAIFMMLGCIGGVLALLSVFGFTLYRRAQAPVPRTSNSPKTSALNPKEEFSK